MRCVSEGRKRDGTWPKWGVTNEENRTVKAICHNVANFSSVWMITLGIDLGTSTVKAVLLDGSTVLATCSKVVYYDVAHF